MLSPGTTLTVLRIAIGVGGWSAPNTTAKLFGLEPGGQPTYLTRLFAVRDLGLAASATGLAGASKKLAWQVGVACDLADVAAAVLGARSGSLSTRSAVMAGGAGAVAAALGVAAIQLGE